MGDHPTVRLSGPTGPVEIDVELAPAISALWQLGIATRQCCQYNELADSAEISFPTVTEMSAFVGAVFPDGFHESDEMQNRISDWAVYDPAASPLRMGWRWIVAPEWDGLKWDFAGRVEFPNSELPRLIERLQRTCMAAQRNRGRPTGRA